MISYAQNFEDVMLARVFANQDQGFYIDVGAGDPVADSVTKHFYDLGWSGINIEPNAAKYEQLCEARPRDINLAIAVSDRPGRVLFHEGQGQGWGLSSCCDSACDRIQRLGFTVQSREVESTTLTSICDVHAADRVIHFLKIDVEGLEERVVRGMDLARYRPVLIVVESTRPNSQEETDASWRPHLLSNGYRDIYFDGLNRFFLRQECANLESSFRTPPNLFDDFQPHAVARRDEIIKEAGAQIASLHSVNTSLHANIIEQQATINELKTTISDLKHRMEVTLEWAAQRFDAIYNQLMGRDLPKPTPIAASPLDLPPHVEGPLHRLEAALRQPWRLIRRQVVRIVGRRN